MKPRARRGKVAGIVTCPDRDTMMKLIESNIREHGFHIYLVGQGTTPRFCYTIGLWSSMGAELALPGAVAFDAVGCAQIVHTIRERLEARIKGDGGESLEAAAARSYAVKELGIFTLRRAHDSWARKTLLGAFDYYRPADVVAYQIVPDASHHTIDIPDMSKEWNQLVRPAPGTQTIDAGLAEAEQLLQGRIQETQIVISA